MSIKTKATDDRFQCNLFYFAVPLPMEKGGIYARAAIKALQQCLSVWYSLATYAKAYLLERSAEQSAQPSLNRP